MKHLKTYFAITDGDGGVVNGHGRTRKKPSMWKVVEEGKLFDQGSSLSFEFYENRIQKKFGGTPTWIHVYQEKANVEELRSELQNERKLQALKKLGPSERRAVERSPNFDPPREENESAIRGNLDAYEFRNMNFLGLGVIDSSGNFINQDGSAPGWQWALVGQPGNGSQSKRRALEHVIRRLENWHGTQIVRVFGEFEKIEDLEPLRSKSNSAAIDRAKMELTEEEVEALGI